MLLIPSLERKPIDGLSFYRKGVGLAWPSTLSLLAARWASSAMLDLSSALGAVRNCWDNTCEE